MAGGEKPNTPRMVEGTDMRSLPIGPLEGFVLTRIDGTLPIPAIAEMTGQPEAQVREAVEKLIALGAAEWVDGPAPGASAEPAADGPGPAGAPPSSAAFAEADTIPPPPDDPSDAEPDPQSASAAHVEAASPIDDGASGEAAPEETGIEDGTPPAYDPAELEEDVDLPMERRKRILDAYYRLEEMDFYAVLGVGRDADKKDIRSSYFALSKVFHPDTLYGRNLGSFKQKMERVFRRITEAYETLGKKKSRAAYDEYLGLKDATDAAEERIGEVDAEAEAIERESLPSAPSTGSGPPPPPSTAPSTPRPASQEARRELFGRRLAAVARTNPTPSVPPGASSIPPRITPPGAGRREVLRDLARSLKLAARHTGGGGQLKRSLDEALRAEEEGDLVEAANALRLATALAPEDEEVQREYDRVHRKLAKGLAETYRKRAAYEEEREEWKAAALSWTHVAAGRPEQAEPHRRAALALTKAAGDLRQARDLAQKAVDLEPEDVRNRVALGKVYLAAGMKLNARRELEEAAKLDPKDEIVKNLLRELNKS